MKKTVGVLAFQGSVEEHLKAVSRAGASAVPVRRRSDLAQVDGIILPGGESTTISKLLHIFDLMNPLRDRILSGMPVWGTCAGMILLAKDIGAEKPHLSVMDISVKRNAYGSQLDSFSTLVSIPKVSSHPLPLVFIRAPYITQYGNACQILCEVDGNTVAVREQNMLATSFHPELTTDLSFYHYFIKML